MKFDIRMERLKNVPLKMLRKLSVQRHHARLGRCLFPLWNMDTGKGLVCRDIISGEKPERHKLQVQTADILKITQLVHSPVSVRLKIRNSP